MGGYLAYTEYKDSGVEWLGKIPTHWKLKRLHHIARLRSGETMTAQMMNENDEFPVYGGNGLRGYYHSYTHEGDYVLIGRQGALCGNINYASGKFWASEHAVVVSPSLELETIWLGELLQTMNLNQYSTSAAQPGISVEQIGRLKIPFPPIEEQRSIARFLDYKTAQIDALIAKKEALLEKLAEKRTALISQAVTKGLDPSVPMKDSGIEWLGEIPRHWEVIRLRFLICKIEQGWSPSCDNRQADIEEWGVLKAGCVNGEEFDENENKALPGDLEPKLQYEIFDGDILMSRANTKELLGSAAIVVNPRKKLLLCDKLYRLFIDESTNKKYLIRLLRSSIARLQYEQDATGASGSMQNIGQDTIKDLTFPIPPLNEQEFISQYLDETLLKLSNTEKTNKEAIAKLKEYRTALITNAVTGKIDVRDIKIPELDSMEAA